MSESPSVPSALPSRLSRLLGWAPATLLLGGVLVSWAVFLAGRGMGSVFAWLALMQLWPLIGLVGLVAGLAVLGVRRVRRWRRPGEPAAGLTGPLGATLLASAVALATLPWNLGVGTMAFPYRLATATPAATVRLPLSAPVRVLWGGDALARNQHAMLPDQRWAYDLGVEPVMAGSKRLGDYGCWGAEVVAPAAGRVHLAHDGEVDLEPGVTGQILKPLGNHVALALPSGTFLLLAHLQQGSVRVREGDLVSEGQPLGRCGNSGHTSEPHVHIHHQRQDPRGRPVNVSEGLPLFFRDHDGAPMPEGGLEERSGRVVATGALVQHRGAPAAP